MPLAELGPFEVFGVAGGQPSGLRTDNALTFATWRACVVNDPHVVALIYRIEHSKSFSYAEAAPFQHEEPQFRVRILSDMARVEMNEHFPTPEEALALVEPFLRVWEVDAGLKNPGVLRFSYQRAEIVDRKPTPGVASFEATARATASAEGVVRMARYPAAPAGLSFSVDVDAMYDSFIRYKAGQIPLGPMADFCLTVLEKGGQRSAAAKKYGIHTKVLSHLGTLAAEKGGRTHSRKWKGWSSDYTGQERAWIEAAVKAIIRRAAEVAHKPLSAKDQITMDDLPHVFRALQAAPVCHTLTSHAWEG